MAKNNKTVEVSVGQNKVAVSERNASIPTHVFLPRIHELAAEGKTQKEVAEALGMKETSFAVRLTAIRKMTDPKTGKVIGPDLLPEFTGAKRGVKTDVTSIMELVAQSKANIAKAKAEAEAAKAQGENQG